MQSIKQVIKMFVLVAAAAALFLAAPAQSACDPSYPTVCVAPAPPDLDCKDISHRNFAVRSPDSHHFDADSDGIGCETPN